MREGPGLLVIFDGLVSANDDHRQRPSSTSSGDRLTVQVSDKCFDNL